MATEQEYGQLNEIIFRLSVRGNDPRLKEMKRNFIGDLTLGVDGHEETHTVKIKSRYTLRDGTIQYRCIPQYTKSLT